MKGKGKRADRGAEGAATAEFLMKLQLSFPSATGAVPGASYTSGAMFLPWPLSQLELAEDSSLGSSSYCF